MLAGACLKEESINEFLMYLRALRRRRLSADELGRELGPDGDIAHQIVNALYTRLEECLQVAALPYAQFGINSVIQQSSEQSTGHITLLVSD